MNLRTSYLVRLFFALIVISVSIQPAFAKKKKKKDKTNLKTTILTTTRDSIFRKPIPFDLESDIAFYNSKTNIDDIISFAKQQLGTPYKYASADPKNGGLDCSGFLYYVFTNYKIKVPRSSKDYMNFGKTISRNDAQKGDVLVFTGTDATQRIGGHVGLVLENNNGDITFIHGSSGKGKGVTISKLSENYYTLRFLKVVRVIN